MCIIYCPFQASWPRDYFLVKKPVTTIRKPYLDNEPTYHPGNYTRRRGKTDRLSSSTTGQHTITFKSVGTETLYVHYHILPTDFPMHIVAYTVKYTLVH
jgi:hypothetical protein